MKTKKTQKELEKAEKQQQRIKKLLNRIREFVGNDKYIFRGENNRYNEKISSKLYRYIEPIFAHAVRGKFGESAQKKGYRLKLNAIQKEFILQDVQEYVDFEKEIDTLAELQHYGGSTNLIDFSHDLAVSLFFACDGKPEKSGRLILLRADDKDIRPPPKNQNNRTVFQKSIFVQRDIGYIKKKEVKQFIVPKGLKKTLLTYVQNYFGVRTETVYGDLMGYIQNQERHKKAHEEFFSGTVYDKIDFEEAVKCYTRAINLKPNFSQAYNNRAAAKTNKKPSDLEGAIADYDEAIKRNPNYVQAYCNLAAAKLDKKPPDSEGAITDCDEAIKRNPNYAKAYGNRGVAYNKKKEYNLAIADLDKAISLNSNDNFSYNNRGISYKEKGDHDLAIANFNKAIELDSSIATVYNNRGSVYHQKGNYDLAIADYDEAIKLNANLVEAYVNRAFTQKILKEDKRAKKDLEIALRLAKKQKNKPFADSIQKELDDLTGDSDK